MRSSLKLFTWFGIPVHLHWSFGLILMYAFWMGLEQGAGILGIVITLALFISLFGCVLLHEFGHSLTAQRYGIQTKDIILTPIGGIARLERMPEKPLQEFWVAIAGPAVNVVIAIVLVLVGKILYSGDLWEIFKALIWDQFGWLWHFFASCKDFIMGALSWSEFQYALSEGAAPLSQTDEILMETGLDVGPLLSVLPLLVSTNIWLVLFNLIPAFPMDGGRVLRALLAMRIGRPRATQTASMVGQIIALLFVMIGLWQGQFGLTLIGFFVFTTARSENQMVQLDHQLRKYTARDLLRPHFTRLSMNDWMQTPISLLQQGTERNFLVFDFEDNIIGALGEDAIVKALKKRDLSSDVSSYMTADWESVDENESLQYIYTLIRQKGLDILPVLGQNSVVGVIDEPGMYHFLALQQKLNQP